MSVWERLNEIVSEAERDHAETGRTFLKLADAVPGKSSKELEQLYLALSWLAGFTGVNFDPKLKHVYWQLEGMASPSMTSKKHDWADAGMKYAQSVKFEG